MAFDAVSRPAGGGRRVKGKTSTSSGFGRHRAAAVVCGGRGRFSGLLVTRRALAVGGASAAAAAVPAATRGEAAVGRWTPGAPLRPSSVEGRGGGAGESRLRPRVAPPGVSTVRRWRLRPTWPVWPSRRVGSRGGAWASRRSVPRGDEPERLWPAGVAHVSPALGLPWSDVCCLVCTRAPRAGER